MIPQIYVMIGFSVIGELGSKSKILQRSICDKCSIYKIEYEKIEYIFDKWGGEDLIKAMDIFLVSERLKEALISADLKGITFKEVEVKKKKGFSYNEGAYGKTLPAFYHLIFKSHAKGPEIWWKKVKCNNCEKHKWDLTIEGIDASTDPIIMGGSEIENPAPRNVFISSWKGEDVFHLEDPEILPLVTKRFIDVLEKINVKDIYYREVNWVDDNNQVVS
jgi:hypothetical protein